MYNSIKIYCNLFLSMRESRYRSIVLMICYRKFEIRNFKPGNVFHLLVDGEDPIVFHFRNANLSPAVASDVDSFTRALAVDLVTGYDITVRSGRKTGLQWLRHIISIIVNGDEGFSSSAESNLVGTVVPPIVHLLACKNCQLVDSNVGETDSFNQLRVYHQQCCGIWPCCRSGANDARTSIRLRMSHPI